MSSYYRIFLENWLKTIDVEAEKVIDIAGSQNPVNKRTRTWSVNTFHILDLKQPHEIKRKPDVVHDMNERLYQVYDYDVAFCLELTEYLWNTEQAFANMRRLLKHNGILYISFCYIYGLHNPAGRDYLRFTPDGAEKVLQEAGFEILEHRLRIPKPDNSYLSKFFIEDGMRIRKDIDQNVTGSLIKARRK